jgi:hypothetical protein
MKGFYRFALVAAVGRLALLGGADECVRHYIALKFSSTSWAELLVLPPDLHKLSSYAAAALLLENPIPPR